MTQMDSMDITAANMKNTVMTLIEGNLAWDMIGIDHLEPLAREPVVSMRPHTAPQSHAKVRIIRTIKINQYPISMKHLFIIPVFYTK